MSDQTDSETRLVWVDADIGSRTPDGKYLVGKCYFGWVHWLPGDQESSQGVFPTREAAKEACERHLQENNQ